MYEVKKANSFYAQGKSTKHFLLLFRLLMKVLALILLGKNILNLMLKTAFLIKSYDTNNEE